MTEYHSFSKERFEQELPKDFEEKNISGTNEYVYDYRLSENFLIRIHSSVDTRKNKSRSSGSDAIRVSLYHEPSDSIIGYDSRTHRIMDDEGNPRWPQNMKKKIKKLKQEWEDQVYECPKCDTGYLRKIDVNGGFYGCVNYPDCEFSTSMDEDGNPDLDDDFECPSCNDGFLRKREHDGSTFFGCSNYPECQFSCNIDENGEPEYDQGDVNSAKQKSKWERVREFLEAHKDGNDFYADLLKSLNQYGQLTEGQMDCIKEEVEIFHNGAEAHEKFPLQDELTDEEEDLLKRFGLFERKPNY